MSDPTPPNDKRDLLSAFDQVVQREKVRAVEAANAGPVRRRTPPWVAVLGLLGWGVLAWTWLARPGWLFPPDPASLATPAQRESTLRFGMYLEADRVLEYLRANGRLPARLEDAGDVEAGVGYAVTGDTTFTLTGQDGTISLTFRSTDSMREFLAPAGISPAPPHQ